ncbi:hypothetical protein [Erythrobacter litoralis]|uniref:Uncharacterized protein n=1 Tax=Erythrobacter litoralis (strain HTCC2594) TaxID=314225 RepID=Q2NDW8_ERYLH|nr:hypothetical protein [Erythrobacter litoralis]ABC62123.1 hypothetical protein ELI_00155 [Erythrobacter litoralis HTCC2594]
MGRLSRFNPAPGVKDFWTEFRRPQPYRIPILLASIAIPGAMLYMFASQETMVPPRSPDVTYITSFAPDRTDDEIIESNIENQLRKDERRERLEEIEARRRALYRELGRASGLDVDAMEAEAEAERIREEAEAEIERRERLDAAGLEEIE